MRKIRIPALLTGVIATAALTACGSTSDDAAVSSAEQDTSVTVGSATTSDTTNTEVADDAPTEATTAIDASISTAGEYHWDESAATTIALADGASSSDAAGVSVDGDIVTITASGAYHVTGNLSDGQLVIDVVDDGAVQLLFDAVSISSSNVAPVSVAKAKNVVIFLADGTTSTLSDARTASASTSSGDTEEPNAALYSTADLVITGNGTLTVDGSYNDGISSKDTLLIDSGTISVAAADDGIRGKDSLTITGGAVTIDAGGDGLTSDNESTSDGATDGIGVISITGGALDITAETDALDAVNEIVIDGGDISIAAGDDALHADAHLTINGGTVEISRSYEGLESAVITITGGDVSVVSSDDGFNVAGGNDSSGQAGPGGGRGPGGQDTFAASGDYYGEISGGTLVIDAGGDGLDANGSLTITGGVIVVSGPTNDGNGALDVDGTFAISGATLVAAGSSGMAETPDQDSEEAFLDIGFQSAITVGTVVEIADSDGKVLGAFEASKAFTSFVFSSPELEEGATYTVTLGGTIDGTTLGGLMTNGSVSGGEVAGTVTAV